MPRAAHTWGMAGQSALSSTSSLSVPARLAKPCGSSRGANCLEAMRSSFRRRSALSSVTGAGICSPNFRGDRNVRLCAPQALRQPDVESSKADECLHTLFSTQARPRVVNTPPACILSWWFYHLKALRRPSCGDRAPGEADKPCHRWTPGCLLLRGITLIHPAHQARITLPSTHQNIYRHET